MTGPGLDDSRLVKTPNKAGGAAHARTSDDQGLFLADVTETSPAGGIISTPPSLGLSVSKNTFPGYEVLRELSRGGQAVLFVAIQKATKRKVAIKVPIAGALVDRTARKRFEREVELCARLRHPNIVTVFDSGQTVDGQPYYVMDYVHGVPLTRYVREKNLTLEDTLKLIAQVCDAVQHAHSRGVVHRDLKPSNILVDASGHPQVLDFGLAKRLAEPVDTLVSMTQQLLGTLPYMSPEQVGGNPDEVDARTDVYALGILLYETLTGHLPYPVRGRVADAMRNIAELPPMPLHHQWTPGSGVERRSSGRHRRGGCPIDDEVETIALKTLAKERDRRYQSAADLRQDIDHYLAGEPIAAKRDSLWYVLCTRAARRRSQMIIGTIVALVVVALSTMAIRQTSRAEVARLKQRIAEAELHLERGDYKQALADVSGIAPHGEDGLRAGLIRSRALSRRGQWDAAQRVLLDLSETQPTAAVWAGLAEVSARTDPERAAHYRQLFERTQRDTAMDYYLRALVESDDKQAVELLTRALELEPEFFPARLSRSLRYYSLKEFDKARQDAEVAASQRPSYNVARYNLGTILIRVDAYRLAVTELETAIREGANFSSVYFNLGVAHELLGQFGDATTAYQEAVRREDSDPKKWYALGRVASRGNDPTLAPRAFEHVLALDPTRADAAYDLGCLHLYAKRFPDAAHWLQVCVDLPTGATNAGAWLWLGYSRRKLGEEVASRAAYDASYGLESHDPILLSNFAWLLLVAENEAVRDWSRALTLALAARQHDPDSIAIKIALALAKARNGDFQGADALARDVLTQEPENPWALGIAAHAAFGLGNMQEGWQRLAAARAAMPSPPDSDLLNYIIELEDTYPPKAEAG